MFVDKLCLSIELCKNSMLLVVLGRREEGSLISMLRQGFPQALVVTERINMEEVTLTLCTSVKAI